MIKRTVKKIIEDAFLKDKVFSIDGFGDKDKIFFYPDDPNAEEKFKEAVRRDRLLEQHIKDNNLILIRISYDQFHDSRKNPYFYDECIEKLFTIINSNNPGIFKIGNKYE